MKKIFFFVLISLFFIKEAYSDITKKIIDNLEKSESYNFMFTQKINKKKESGNCILVFDRKINCSYNYSGKILVSDGKNLIIKSKNSEIANFYKLKNTSFYKLLDKNYLINKLKSTHIKNIEGKLFVKLNYQNIDIEVFFDNEKLLLKGWQTIDIYNNSVLTEINIQDINKIVDEDLFDLRKFN